MAKSSLAIQVGKTIRHLRKEAELSQEEFADLCGLHRTYIGSIERGEKVMTIDTAAKLAQVLDLSLSQLFERVEIHKKHGL